VRGLLLDPKTGLSNTGYGFVDVPRHGEDEDSWWARVQRQELRNRAAAGLPIASGGSKQGFNELIQVDLADGTQVLNTVTRTIIAPDYTFAAGDPRIYPGATWRVTCYFDVSFVITTPGTITLDLRWGGQAGTVLATTGAYAPDPTAAVSNKAGFIKFVTTWRTIGSAGSAFTMGEAQFADVDDASATTLKNNLDMSVFPNSPAVVSSLDTTTSKALSVCVTFSVATATTQLTNHIRLIELLN